ncbi:MAG TPA: amino acid ABC transporter permease [Acetobacteraceae bacterium]|nr:amino acid ABC transporter permease [Acetobacteraceae bacterium]
MTHFTLHYFIGILPLLLDGMVVTVELTAASLAGGLLLGIILAVLRISRFRPVAIAAAFYVNLLRSLPLLLLIFWFYFLVPLLVGRPVGGMTSALIGFILFEGAYFCEIVRAGLQSVRRGQVLAGLASGLTYPQTMRRIILPQALRNMLPVLLTEAINLFKSTALVYVVGVRDFLTAASIIGTRDNNLVPLYLLAAVVYFVLCLTASLSVGRLRRSYAL